MKIRLGFVSNSSTSSFCLYGWYKHNLTAEQIELVKAIANVEEFCDDSNDYIGIGNQENDLHFEDDDEAMDYECDGPSDEEMAKLDKFALEQNLPKPDMYGSTFRNG